jgi:anthranilate phosphoribosyltransferase
VRGHTVALRRIVPEDAGLERAPIEALQGGDAVENAAILRRIFDGERGPCRDIVLLNAAAVLIVSGLVNDLRQGVELAAKTIDSGAVRVLVERLQPERSE